MKRVIIIVLLSLSIFSCKKNTDPSELLGTVKDLTGLDGCKIMIVLENGTKLEINSLPAGVTLVKDKRVAITYKIVSGFSICMAGDIADITSLRYL
jgi:nitrogen fixation protein